VIINSLEDIKNAPASAEKLAFLDNLLSDTIVYDDASYPEDYDHSLQPGDDGYIEPQIRTERNLIPMQRWGFQSESEVTAMRDKVQSELKA